jgi:hypothetical protein
MANRNTRRVVKPPAKAEATSDTLKKVMEFVARAKRCNDEPIEKDAMKQINRHLAVLDEARVFDESLGPGLKVGRLVGWPRGDGTAWYFITKVGGQVCELEWMPGIDAWHSEVVQGGVALTSAVARAAGWSEGLRKIFGKKSKPT